MIHLKQIDFYTVQQYFVDYQKKSKNFEMPPEAAEYWGVYKDTEFIGYFITVAYTAGYVEINQGYLKPEARHKTYSRIAMQLLEDLIRKDGRYKEIVLGTNRAVGSYRKFMSQCGFELTRTIFTKRLN